MNIADETFTDYSFLCRYHYTKSKNYLKRRHRIRHWIPMFIGTPCINLFFFWTLISHQSFSSFPSTSVRALGLFKHSSHSVQTQYTICVYLSWAFLYIFSWLSIHKSRQLWLSSYQKSHKGGYHNNLKVLEGYVVNQTCQFPFIPFFNKYTKFC